MGSKSNPYVAMVMIIFQDYYNIDDHQGGNDDDDDQDDEDHRGRWEKGG